MLSALWNWVFPAKDYKTEYGDINKIKATGVRRSNPREGKEESRAMAENDLKSMKKYKSIIYNVAKEHKIDPALIAGIISRESRAGTAIEKTNGWGDYDTKRREYNAFGLMQVDVNPEGGNHEREGEWDSETHLDQATGILVHFIKRIQKKFKNWSKEEQLKGGIAAYNMGDGNVKSCNVDEHTTGGDYSNDVVVRAQWYKENYFKD